MSDVVENSDNDNNNNKSNSSSKSDSDLNNDDNDDDDDDKRERERERECRCATCAKSNPSMRCSRYWVTFYCDQKCQKADRKFHKKYSCHTATTATTTTTPTTTQTYAATENQSVMTGSVEVEWRSLCTTIHSSIQQVPELENYATKVVPFGSERVLLQVQTYRCNIPISSLLLNYLFVQDFHKVAQNQIKTTTPDTETILLHIASIGRAKEIFNIAGLCAAEVYDTSISDDKIRYSCCGKVFLLNLDNNKETNDQ